jgi:von Willebrand factor type A domain.
MDMKHIIRKRAVSLVLAFMMAIGCTFSSVAEFPAAADSGHMDSNAQKISADDIVKDTGPMLMGAASFFSPLGAAQGYNLVCFDTLKANADVQGKSFVGKKVDCENGFTFGGTLDDEDCSLVFGATEKGNFKAGNKGLRGILVYDSGIGNEIKSVEGGSFKRYDHWNSKENLKEITGIDLTLSDKKLNGVSITKFQKQMIDLSDRLPDAHATGKVYVQNGSYDLVLIGSDPDINVFNIDGNNVEKSGKELKNLGGVYIGIPQGSTAVINVSGSKVGLPSGGMYYTKATEYKGDNDNDYKNNKYDDLYVKAQQRKVLWNFSGATEVEFRGQVSGSVLAPKALATANKGGCGGNIEGELIANSVQWDGTFEAHNFPFDGELPKDESQPILNKTAALADWDKRTYDISLSVTATSKMVTTSVPSDIILVLDCSSSMGNRMGYRPFTGSPERNQNYYIMVSGTPKKVNWSNQYSKWYYYDWYRDENVYVIPTAGKSGEPDVRTITASAADTDYSYYYIEVNGKKHWVYYDGWEYAWYYYDDSYDVRYLDGSDILKYESGFLLYQFYTEYSYMDALKEAAVGFVQTVNTNSPDSRIGVVSFANSAAIKTKNSSGDSLLRVGNSVSKNLIDQAIESLMPSGYTHADDGLSKAAELFGNTSLYEAVTTESPRSKAVVFFTDGAPNHGDEYGSPGGFDPRIAQNAIACAETLKGEPYQATVYSIGVFTGLGGGYLTQVEDYMKQVASYKSDSTTEKRYYPVSDSKSLGDIFQAISQEAGGISEATITDVIDKRFELTVESRAALVESGASITDNPNGTQTITWLNQKIEVKKDGSGNLLPSWTYQDIHVRAKNEFVGGNNIPTNVPEISGIRYGEGRFVEFPRPTVNVKPRFYLGNTETTIFLGEAVPPATLEPYTLDKNGSQVTGNAMYCGLDPTGAFSYQWSDAGGTGIAGATDKAFPSSPKQYPGDNMHYTLTAWFTPNGSGTKTPNTVVSEEHREGKYIVNVRSGSLTVTKTITNVPSTVNEKGRSFVFLVTGTAAENCKAITPFYVTLTMNGNGTGASKTITGLSKGTYTITEVNSNWQYDRGPVQWVDSKSALGYHQDAVTKEFSDISISATCTNNYAHSQWFSATDSVANLFNREELK